MHLDADQEYGGIHESLVGFPGIDWVSIQQGFRRVLKETGESRVRMSTESWGVEVAQATGIAYPFSITSSETLKYSGLPLVAPDGPEDPFYG